MLIRFLRERFRAEAIDDLGILGMPSESGLNRFVDLAANAFAAPLAALNVIHGDQLWIKACAGFAATCIPRSESFCQYTLEREDLLEVCDASIHPTFRELSVVSGEMGIRYYIGAPLTIADGTDIGALCVMDTRPRAPASADQRAYLLGVARHAANALERHAHRKGRVAA